MAKDCCNTEAGCAPVKKKGCCSLKKVLGLVVVAGVVSFLWKKFK